jgi:hypothetical protein
VRCFYQLFGVKGLRIWDKNVWKGCVWLKTRISRRYCEIRHDPCGSTKGRQMFLYQRSKLRKYKNSGPSSYDRLDIRTTWVTTKKFSFDLRLKS